MASVTKDNQNERRSRPEPDRDEVRSLDVARRTESDGDGAGGGGGGSAGGAGAGGRGGFFTIYKKGQGYWTRMGTLLGVGLILFMLAYTLYSQVPTFFFGSDAAGQAAGRKVGIGLAVGFLVVAGLVALRLMNKPSNVDFLIATDSEMKKVNWTSRKELVGSSKVVILFMFFVALYLFLNDIIFGYLMYIIRVLKLPPPPFKGY